MNGKLKRLIPLGPVLVLIAAAALYAGTGYRAEDIAVTAMETAGDVSVSATGYGWLIDGPSDENVLVFYPGAKVEEIAYMPLLRLLAGRGMDVCLVKMPLRFAFFGVNKADEVFRLYGYENRYVGGHSLGGAMAAQYAANRADMLRGVILLAAYPTETLDDSLVLVSVYGSEDGVLNMEKVAAGRQLAPSAYTEYVIEGGNHAQFGNYGIQKGDGPAAVTPAQQQEQTADVIIRCTEGARK